MEFKLRKNDNPKRPALEMVTEFYDFLQGESPEKIIIPKGHMPKMSKKKSDGNYLVLTRGFARFARFNRALR